PGGPQPAAAGRGPGSAGCRVAAPRGGNHPAAGRREGPVKPTMTLVLILLLTPALLPAPLAVDAQTARKVYRIGYLTSGAGIEESPREALRQLGYVEGQNLVIEGRFAEQKLDRLPELAAELGRLNVDVIVTVSTPAALAAKKAITTIPIV